MAKKTQARTEQTPSKAEIDANLRDVHVDAEAYELTVAFLRRLQALLLCMSANNRKGFKSLSSQEKDDILSLALSLAYEAEQMLENGSI